MPFLCISLVEALVGRTSRVRTAETACKLSVRQQRCDFALAVQADGGAAGYRLCAEGAGTRGFDLDIRLTRGATVQERSKSIFHAVDYAVGMVICGSPG